MENMNQGNMLNKNFYPTPQGLIRRMLSKIQGEPTSALEPSAGKGDIIAALESRFNRQINVSAIETDETLQAALRGMEIKVIDSDFLSYSGCDKFDLIIANPPFDNGDMHLLKAIDIMYRGEIVFLLNAETLKNPYTNTRKDLVARLAKLNATIEYLQGEFLDAERPTGVEIALVYIEIKRDAEADLFSGATDKAEGINPHLEEKNELSTGKTIAELVAEYNTIIDAGVSTIVGYYRNYKKIGEYIGLNKAADKDCCSSSGNLTSKMQDAVNAMLITVRADFWRRTLSIDTVTKRLTEKKQYEFEYQLKKRSDMDFTESNIHQFVLNIIGGYEQTLTEAVLEIFDKFTVKHCYSGGFYDDNIHLFNGWKTNKAFKVCKKVIIPLSGGYGGEVFTSYGKWRLHYAAKGQLNDIDKVMNYFDGMDAYRSTSDAIECAFANGITSKINSTYFTITVYKKGTIHLVFNSDDILRRFNLAACKGKKWLPDDYGARTYADSKQAEKDVIDSFDGEKVYTQKFNMPIFANKTTVLKLTA